MQLQENRGNKLIDRLMGMKDVEVLAHCLLFDDVWIERDMIGAKMYTIIKLKIV